MVKPIALAQSNAVAPFVLILSPLTFSAPRLTSLISNYTPICQFLCPSNIVSSSIPITLLHMTLFLTFLIAMVLTPLMSLFNLVLFMKSSSIPVLSLRVSLAFSVPLFLTSTSRRLMSFPVRKKKQQSWHSLSKKKKRKTEQPATSSITQTKAKRIPRA